MSDILPTTIIENQSPAPLTPHEELVLDLKRPDSIKYRTNAGQLGDVINTYVTESNPQHPALNKIDINNGISMADEQHLPIAESGKVQPNLIVEITKNATHHAPIRLTIEKEGDEQVARLSLDLRKVTEGFGNNFSLDQLRANFFTLVDVATTMKNIGDKAREANNSTWIVSLDDITEGPILERRTPHGQTQESFSQVFNKLTNDKFTIRQETFKEKAKRTMSGDYL